MSRFAGQTTVPQVPQFRPELVPAFLALASAAALAWQSWSPGRVIIAGLAVDRLTAAVGLFIAVVGLVVQRFAARAMQGHPDRRRFITLLCLATCLAFAVSTASNLILLLASWILLGAMLHPLLTFTATSVAAWRTARRAFVVARISDLSMTIALAALWWHGGSLELSACLGAMSQAPDASVAWVAVPLAVAAMARSAQWPFHSWLPDTMEAPSPVSALLHAGIVNAGGILLIRCAALLARSPESCMLLAGVGTVTIVLGSLAAAQQVRLKQSLAWSTVAQMGFMTVQCAVAAYPAALLHVIGHGAYKAAAFLGSGDPPKRPRRTGSAGWNLLWLVTGAVAAWPAMMLAERCTGFSPWHAPGETALAMVVAVAIGQAWVAILAGQGLRPAVLTRGLCMVALVTVAAPVACFALYQGAAAFLMPALGEWPVPATAHAWIAAMVPAAAIAVLAVSHAIEPWLRTSSSWRSIQVQARSGFHLGRLTDRVLDSVRALHAPKETGHA
jgi:NAD(P)H-quinone oxidoreductase subunit 5